MSRRHVISATIFALLLSMGALAQQIGLSNQIWSAEIIRTKGQPVIPLFDGWFPNEDGSSNICFGFFNMNLQEALNVPLGESNYLETDYPGLDLSGVMLPTHFDPLPPRYRHVFGAFSLNVPAGIQFPQLIQAKVNEPITLSAHIEHADEEVWVGWSHHSGPGSVEFSNKEYMTESGSSTSTQLQISEAGEYVIRMQTIDDVAAFEFYCCHTNAYFSIQVDD